MVARRVVVVGASSGLGAAIAVLHRCAGDYVVAAARRSHRLNDLEAFSRVRGAGRWESAEVDLLDEAAEVRLQAHCSSLWGEPSQDPGGTTSPHLIYLVAARGDADLRTQIYLNFVTTAELAQWFARPGTVVVLISSLAALIPFAEMAAYCASKAALEAWAEAHTVDHDDRLVIVRPGKFRSEFGGSPPVDDLAELPWRTARQVREQVLEGHRSITLGGWRDRLAVLLASPIGRRLPRHLLK